MLWQSVLIISASFPRNHVFSVILLWWMGLNTEIPMSPGHSCYGNMASHRCKFNNWLASLVRGFTHNWPQNLKINGLKLNTHLAWIFDILSKNQTFFDVVDSLLFWFLEQESFIPIQGVEVFQEWVTTLYIVKINRTFYFQFHGRLK